MTWLQRHKLRASIKSSLWMVPMLCVVIALIFHRLARELDIWAHWQLLDFSLESARSLASAISVAMLTFIVFLMSMLFIALQLAVGQLTPRIMAFAFSRRSIKITLGIFTFTYMFSIAALSRLGDPVPQLVIFVMIVSTLASIAAFLLFVDYMGKSLRPISICEELADSCSKIIETIYPAMLSPEKSDVSRSSETLLGKASCTINHEGGSGIIMAFDPEGLVKIASRNNCVVRLIPQMGDFVTKGDPIFSIYKGGQCLGFNDLRHSVAFSIERTIEQDPGFVLRIIVDIAIKALSPAINDPTTAISCIDQLHRLLREIGQRDLGDGELRDRHGKLRCVFPTPDWEDYVQLAVSEILHYGAGSIQVVRRLRAMLDDLLMQLPEIRLPEINAHLKLLGRFVGQNFTDPDEKELALSGDYKGLGGARLK